MRPSSKAAWPPAPSIPDGAQHPDAAQLELYKAELAARLEEVKHELALEIEAAKGRNAADAANNSFVAASNSADYAFYHGVLADYYKGYLEVAKGSVDRSMTRMQRTQEAAVAVGALYTGILAFLAARVDASDSAQEGFALLDSRALIPTVFLGLAILFSTAYVSFLTPLGEITNDGGSADNQTDLDIERNNFIRWSTTVPDWRTKLSQLAVMALGLGVASLPIAFVEGLTNREAALIGTIAALLMLTVWFVAWETRKSVPLWKRCMGKIHHNVSQNAVVQDASNPVEEKPPVMQPAIANLRPPPPPPVWPPTKSG